MTAILLSNGTRFENAEERIREYCEIEVYQGYDDRHSIDNRITTDDVQAANELYAMIDRYDATESSRIVGAAEVESALANVEDFDLACLDSQEWSALKPKLRILFTQFLSIRGVGLAKATKILHLKRPHMFPVLDSFVVKFLSGTDPSTVLEKKKSIELGLIVMSIAWSDLSQNRANFQRLESQLADLSITLTYARMYDILCWTQEKWVVRGNTHAKYGTAARSIS